MSVWPATFSSPRGLSMSSHYSTCHALEQFPEILSPEAEFVMGCAWATSSAQPLNRWTGNLEASQLCIWYNLKAPLQEKREFRLPLGILVPGEVREGRWGDTEVSTSAGRVARALSRPSEGEGHTTRCYHPEPGGKVSHSQGGSRQTSPVRRDKMENADNPSVGEDTGQQEDSLTAGGDEGRCGHSGRRFTP